MKSLRPIFLLALCAAPHARAGGREESKERRVAHFALALPAGCTLHDRSPRMLDFMIWEIRTAHSSASALRLYFGSAPRFPAYAWDSPPVRATAGTCERLTHDYRARDGAMEGVFICSGLSYRGTPGSPFTRIHYFATGVDPDTAAVYARILATLHVVEPDLK